MVEPVAFLVPRITGDLGVSECTFVFVFVCAMPCGHLSITGQAEDGCDSQMDAGVWVSAALRLWVGYLVQRGHLEELGWGPRSSVQRRSCWCPVGARSAPWEVLSNMVKPTHTQATTPGVLSCEESNTLGLPSIPAAEFGWHLGTHLLLVTTDVCGV